MATAAYNAGPSRPRNWRKGPVLDAAIWAENIPFLETRDYVKKVLSNTTNYAAILTGQPQSLKARLGLVGPRTSPVAEASKDLP
jgi:soluble lytic murein transglycosylase